MRTTVLVNQNVLSQLDQLVEHYAAQLGNTASRPLATYAAMRHLHTLIQADKAPGVKAGLLEAGPNVLSLNFPDDVLPVFAAVSSEYSDTSLLSASRGAIGDLGVNQGAVVAHSILVYAKHIQAVAA